MEMLCYPTRRVGVAASQVAEVEGYPSPQAVLAPPPPPPAFQSHTTVRIIEGPSPTTTAIQFHTTRQAALAPLQVEQVCCPTRQASFTPPRVMLCCQVGLALPPLLALGMMPVILPRVVRCDACQGDIEGRASLVRRPC
eukprot:Rmarinus@m.12217